jgi:hypothetical protein
VCQLPDKLYIAFICFPGSVRRLELHFYQVMIGTHIQSLPFKVPSQDRAGSCAAKISCPVAVEHAQALNSNGTIDQRPKRSLIPLPSGVKALEMRMQYTQRCTSVVSIRYSFPWSPVPNSCRVRPPVSKDLATRSARDRKRQAAFHYFSFSVIRGSFHGSHRRSFPHWVWRNSRRR